MRFQHVTAQHRYLSFTQSPLYRFAREWSTTAVLDKSALPKTRLTQIHYVSDQSTLPKTSLRQIHNVLNKSALPKTSLRQIHYLLNKSSVAKTSLRQNLSQTNLYNRS